MLNFNKLVVFLGSFICCLGCSNFSFETNLFPNDMEDYFETANISVYKNSELVDLDYYDLGTVEGISCQAKSDDPRSSIQEARTLVREEAHKKGANGIVYSTCVELENTPGCVTSVSCYARAVYVKDNDE